MSWHPSKRLLNMPEAARSIGRPQSTIRRWISEGRLPVFARQGRRVFVLESDLLKAEAEARRAA
jgi:excisionase family DNA binding protein